MAFGEVGGAVGDHLAVDDGAAATGASGNGAGKAVKAEPAQEATPAPKPEAKSEPKPLAERATVPGFQ